MKAPFELVEYRSQFYKHVLLAVFKSLGIPTAKLRFVEGSSFQYSKEYTRDNFKMCAKVTEHDARRAGAEVVKQEENPLLSGLLYPWDAGARRSVPRLRFPVRRCRPGARNAHASNTSRTTTDEPLALQRKIFIHAETFLPRIGYPKRAHLMNEMVPGLTAGGKMSASDPNSKIDLLDPPKVVEKKIKGAFCEEGNVDVNGPLSFVKAVLIPISQLRLERLKEGGAALEEGVGDQRTFAAEDAPKGSVFTIIRPEKYGGPLHYSSFDDLKQDFADKKIHPGDLKTAVLAALNRLLAPIRLLYEESEEWQAGCGGRRIPIPMLRLLQRRKRYARVLRGRNQTEGVSLGEEIPPAPTR